jgi:hypothetical protein
MSIFVIYSTEKDPEVWREAIEGVKASGARVVVTKFSTFNGDGQRGKSSKQGCCC